MFACRIIPSLRIIAAISRDTEAASSSVPAIELETQPSDAPSLHTMYVDKPMKGHGLMQAIARVNRVFCDKPAGLVVDYIGIAQNLESALGQYSSGDREQVGMAGGVVWLAYGIA